MSPPAVVEVFRALATVLGEEGIRWYVFGAQAVLAYGVPRLTADVDVTIDAGDRSNGVVLAAFERFGIVARAPGFEDFLARSRLLPLVHEPSSIAVDVVLASRDGIEQDFLARAHTLELGGVALPVLCVEDLIATKVVAGRRKDRDDVLGILEQRRADIDMDRLGQTLREFDAALEEPRAVKRFESIRKAFERRRRL